MRRHFPFLILASGILLIAPLSSCAPASETFTFEKSQYIFDIFAEEDITFKEFVATNTYTWSSSDNSIATVTNNGHVSCQGKVGEATITVTSGNISGSTTISCKNQMINPSISAEDFTSFINVGVAPNVQVRYSDKYYPLENYTLRSLDTSVATISNKEVVGVKEGEAMIAINGVWKNKTLKERKIKVTIAEGTNIFLTSDTYDVYSVDNTSTVKQNEVTVEGDVFVGGQKHDSGLVVSLEPNPYVAASQDKITIVNPYTGIEPYVVNGVVSSELDPSITKEITVNVHPNFVTKDAKAEIEPTFKAKIELEYEAYEGHPNAYKYFIPDEPINQNTTNKAWSAWDTRIEFYETTTKNGVHAYNSLMEKGYTLLAFDMYYLGTKGVYIGAYGSNEYFYNEVQINRDDMLLVNSHGVATNTLTNDGWYTVYISLSDLILKSMEQGQVSSAIFVGPCFVNDVCYLDNIRYYYDFAPLSEVEIGYDNNARPLVVDENNENKATTSNEFVVYSPTYVSHTLDTNTSLYKYDSSNASAFDRESRSKITPYNLQTGIAVRAGYKYLAFSYIYTSGSPIFYYFNNYTNSTKNIILNGKTGTNEFVKYYKDGLPVSSFNAGEKVTVVIKIDGRATNPLYVTSSVSTIFETGDYTYYKDSSYIKDYSYNAPLEIFVDNVDTAYVGDEIEIKKYINVLYEGKKIENFSTGTVILSSRIGQYYDGKIFTKGIGRLVVSFKVSVGQYELSSQIEINIREDSYLELANESIQLYAGDKDWFEKTANINALAVINKTVASDDLINYQLVNNNGVVSLSGNKVTALKEGVEQIRVSINDNGTIIEKFVDINVFNKYRKGSFSFSSLDATSPATYTQTNTTIYGVTNPYLYQASVASWNNKLDITETMHTDVSKSKSNIINGHIAYITYKFLLSANTTVRAACVNTNGSHTNVALTAGGTLSLANNENIKIYDANGNIPSTLAVNTWYELRVDYSNFASFYKSGYTCHELTYSKGNMYISDIRYYHEAIN